MAYARDTFEPDDAEAGLLWSNFITSLQMWSGLQDKQPVTVREAATAFNVTDAVVREAVDEHYWMFLDGPEDDPTKQTIEHEGE